MKNESTFKMIIKDLQNPKKQIIATSISYSLFSSIKPYIYILFLSWITNAFLHKQNINYVLLICFFALVLNCVFSILCYWLQNRNLEHKDLLNMIEKNNITQKLFNIKYSLLESNDIEKKINQHRDETDNLGGIFLNTLEIIEKSISSIVICVISVVLMRNLFQLFFVEVGPSFFESKWFGIIIILSVVLVSLLLFAITGFVNKKIIRIRNEYAETNFIFEYYQKMICNYKTGKEIRIFNQKPYILKHAAEKLITQGLGLQKKISTYYATASGFGSIILAILSVSVYILVGTRTKIGICSIGDMILFIGCYHQIVSVFKDSADVFGQAISVAPRAKMYYEIINAEEEMGITHKKSLPQSNPVIEFKNVSFKYDQEYVLKDVNITINPGEKIAIVGENGSGKTTFIKIMCGLLPVTEGQVLANSININELDISNYYSMFSVVFQDFHLFSLPLGENISTKNTFDSSIVSGLLNSVGFKADINLQSFLYKDCDNNGVEISGGEAQKIALARALYKKSPIIVLDEPTAALDPYAENLIYTKLNELVSERTAIYISHRLSSCKFCEKIVVFDNGKIVQIGTHDELVCKKAGKYYELWHAQAKYYQN